MWNKVISEDVINFNKEIFFMEIGSVIGILSFSYAASFFFSSPNALSTAIVIGAISVAAVFWMSMRIYDQTRKKKFKFKELLGDVIYFTPAAFVIASLVYYPSLFFISRYLFEEGDKILYSAIISQILAFSFFLVSINAYRYFLLKFFGKKL